MKVGTSSWLAPGPKVRCPVSRVGRCHLTSQGAAAGFSASPVSILTSLDSDTKVSDNILADYLLEGSGLTDEQVVMVRTACGNRSVSEYLRNACAGSIPISKIGRLAAHQLELISRTGIAR